MLHVLNEYGTNPAPPGAATLKIESLRTGVYVATVDADMAFYMKKFRWCYEPDKAQVYCTDTSCKTTSVIGINGSRLYLWKYLLWVAYGKHARFWHRKTHNDYRIYDSNGIAEFYPDQNPPQDSQPVRAVAVEASSGAVSSV